MSLIGKKVICKIHYNSLPFTGTIVSEPAMDKEGNWFLLIQQDGCNFNLISVETSNIDLLEEIE